VAAERDVSANLLVTRALEAYLDALPSLDEALPRRPASSESTVSEVSA